MLNAILDILGLTYDPDRDAPPGPRRTKRTGGQSKVDKPDNVEPGPDGHDYLREVEKEDSRTTEMWTRMDIVRELSAEELTDTDKAILRSRGLDADKAKVLKPYFAIGQSAAQASGKFKNKRGYGVRTVEKYWAAFNVAKEMAPTPIAGEG